ncbi:hypothetical protein SAMN04515617_12412 [Collimonas sp. OK242]|jgi:hypothetical protein|nr:hypothetical protein SAMN04515617_12412 [Collimonas sp. OK242]
MLLMQKLSWGKYQYLQGVKTKVRVNLTASSLAGAHISTPFVLHRAEIGLFFRSRDCDRPGLIQLIYNNRRYGP